MRKQLSYTWLTTLLMVLYLVNRYKACKYRVPITYLILAQAIYSFIVIQYWVPDSFLGQYQKYYLPIFILSIVVLVSMFFVPINSYLQTLLFTIFIILLALSFNPLYRLSKHNSVILPCLITVIMMFIILSIIAYHNISLINLKWSSMLLFGLISIILLRVSFIWFTPSRGLLKVMSYIGIVLFSFFILYDTKKMVVRANQCDIKYNYLQNVISLFLDFINLLSETLSLSNMRK